MLAFRSGYASATAKSRPSAWREDALGGSRLRRALRPDRRGARLRDRLEGAALVGRVALDRLDEVRDQVVAPLELHLDLRPRVVDPVALLDEAVVQRDHVDHEQHDDDENADQHPGHGRHSIRSAAPWREPRTICWHRVGRSSYRPARLSRAGAPSTRSTEPTRGYERRYRRGACVYRVRVCTNRRGISKMPATGSREGHVEKEAPRSRRARSRVSLARRRSGERWERGRHAALQGASERNAGVKGVGASLQEIVRETRGRRHQRRRRSGADVGRRRSPRPECA